MHKPAVWILLALSAALNIAGCRPTISPQEAKVMVTLAEIQRGIEADIELDKFDQLLTTAQAEIVLLNQKIRTNPCFQNAVEKSYASYEIAKKAWQRKMEVQDESRKADMEMALSFSLSFSALNIERAHRCYQ